MEGCWSVAGYRCTHYKCFLEVAVHLSELLYCRRTPEPHLEMCVPQKKNMQTHTQLEVGIKPTAPETTERPTESMYCS